MTHSAAVLNPPPVIAALDDELASHAQHPLCSDAVRGVPPATWDAAIGSHLREFLGRPGKELRGRMAECFFALASGGAPAPQNLSLIVEALHAGSLVVDDIEDDSVERRGGPTLHRLCGVGLALNAGNWLYFWAARLLMGLELSEHGRIAAYDLMTRSLLDCHYGQALDLSARASKLSQAELPAIVRATSDLKTGSLVALSAALGALAGGGADHVVQAAYRFGRDIGVGLQMLDDLSGTVSSKRLAKGVEDLRNDRPTWVWAWLATSLATTEFQRLRVMAARVAEGSDASSLLAEMRAHLPGKRRAIREFLEAAFIRLGNAFPQGNELRTLRAELERWQASYV